jgi:hypothetical protein
MQYGNVAERGKEYIIVGLPICKKGELTVLIIEGYYSSQLYSILANILLSRLTPCVDEIILDHQCGFRRIDQLLNTHSASVRYRRKVEVRCNCA